MINKNNMDNMENIDSKTTYISLFVVYFNFCVSIFFVGSCIFCILVCLCISEFEVLVCKCLGRVQKKKVAKFNKQFIKKRKCVK